MSDFRKKICPLPFTQLSMHSSGKVTPCCWLYDYELGNIKSSSLEDIWKSEKLKTLRKEFLDGNPIICKNAIEKAQCNFHHMDLDEFVDLREELPMPMMKLDLMLGGKCNLECIMCHNWKDPNGVYTEERFWIEARKKVFPYLKELEVYGGEPFIQPEVFQLMNEVSELNPDCKWLFTTNAHYKFSKRLKEHLDKINLRSIAISMDSLDSKTFSKIRKLGKLDLVTDTLHRYLEYRQSLPKERQFIMVLNVVVQRDNWREVGDFIRFAVDKNLNLFFYLLNEPDGLRINKMENDDIKHVLRHWLLENENLKDIRLLKLIRQLMKGLHPSLTIDFQMSFAKSYTETLEQIHYFKSASK